MLKIYKNLSPDPAGGGGFTEDQEKVIQARITAELEKSPKIDLKSATKFIENSEGLVFLSQKGYQDKVIETIDRVQKERIDNPSELENRLFKFKGDAAGEALTPVDAQIMALTEMKKKEGEKTRDYAARVLPTLKGNKTGEVDITEFNAIKHAKENLEKQLEEKDAKLKGMNNDILKNMRADIFNKGISDASLKYPSEELSLVTVGIKSKLSDTFDFIKDEKGFKVVHKDSQEMQTNTDGTRKDPALVVTEFVKALPGLKFDTNSQNSGAGIPGTKGENNEQVKELEDKWNKELAEKGMIGVEKQAQLMRKNLGLPLSSAAKKAFPELA